MSGEIKPVPVGAEQLASFQIYRNTCQAELQSRLPGNASSLFDNSKVRVFNRHAGDGRFELLYDDPARNFSCSGQWLWEGRELLIRGGGRGKGQDRPLGGGWIDDACAATALLAGAEEFGGMSCVDSQAGLTEAGKYSSGEQFAAGCRSLLQSRFGDVAAERFDLAHVRIQNPVPGDGSYSLLFESRAKNLFCAGDVDVSAHQMALRAGLLKEEESAEPARFLEMTDACSMTRRLVGEWELLSPDCQDMNASERRTTSYLTYGFYGVANLLAIMGLYKIGKRFLASQAFRQMGGLPLFRNLGYGLLGYTAFDEATGLFLDKDNPIRHYGKWVAGGVGFFGPSIAARTGLAARVAASPALSRVGGFASRATWGLAAVAGLNYVFHRWVVGDDYEESLNSRVTDKVYHDDGLYDYSFWKCVNPLSWLNKSRRVFRAVAPSAMEWGVSKDNSDLKEKFRKEDQENAAQAQAYLKDVMPLLLHSENWEEVNASIVLLRDEKIQPNNIEQILAQSIPEGPEAVQEQAKLFGQNWSETELDDFIRKALCQKVQEAAAFLVYVPGPHSEWAKALFNKDGTLKGEADGNGKFPYMNAQERWPEPPPEKVEVTSENFDFSHRSPDMA
ncbi:MAG: hypothetical protein U1F66_05045 [bacterium]